MTRDRTSGRTTSRQTDRQLDHQLDHQETSMTPFAASHTASASSVLLNRSSAMNLLPMQLARAQCRADQHAAEQYRLVRALRAQRRATRASQAARRAEERLLAGATASATA